MEQLLRRRSIVRMSVEVETPSLKPEQVLKTSSSIEEIKLKFEVQMICNHFVAEENGDTMLESQHESQKVPFATHHLPIEFFTCFNGGLLQQVLLSKFKIYSNRILNVKTIADKIINKWTKIEQKAAKNSSLFGKVFPIKVTLKLWNVVMRYENASENRIDNSTCRMIPTTKNAIEMLTIVRIEDMESGRACVICLEEITQEEESAILVQMPCLHVFHGECLKSWLTNSHYCPTCRFEMPT